MPAPLPRMKRKDLIEAARMAAKLEGEGLSLDRFVQVTGITHRAVCKVFPRWSDLRVAAGLGRQNRTGPPRYTDEELLQAYEQVAKKILALPSSRTFEAVSGIAWLTIQRRFGSKEEIVRRFRERTTVKWRVEEEREGCGLRIRRRVTKRDIPWMREVWEGLRLGFETHSSHFRGRDPRCVDLLVVGVHDWPECPVKVIELKRVKPYDKTEWGDGGGGSGPKYDVPYQRAGAPGWLEPKGEDRDGM